MMFYRHGLNKLAIVHFPEKPFLCNIIFSIVEVYKSATEDWDHKLYITSTRTAATLGADL